jgi:uncharacterized protein with NRDE domain
MCLLAWSWEPETDHPFTLIGNRDEFYARPTQSLHWWDDKVLAGRDLQEGGTWLGISRQGKLAVLTNYRDPRLSRSNVLSRGHLVAEFLRNDGTLESYLEHLCAVSQSYNPFNLLLYDGTKLKGFESRHAKIVDIGPGIGGLSNADFNSPWPKLKTLKGQLKSSFENGLADNSYFMSLLQNSTPAADGELPNTGISIERERDLSSCFVRMPEYGTRASSIVRVSRKEVSFIEQSYDSKGITDLNEFISRI